MIDFKFEFDFTIEKLTKSLTLYQGKVEILFDSINRIIPKYRISSESRLAGFIDQYEYKTNGFIDLDAIKNIDEVVLRRFLNFSKIPANEANKYYSTLDGALDLAGWYWNTNYLNIVSDNQDINNLSRRINPGLENVDERSKNYHRIRKILKGEL